MPRRLGLLAAKLVVSAAIALLLAFLTVGCDAEVLYLVYGRELAEVPADWPALSVSWIGLVVGCAWAGVLAAGIFRSTTAGLAALVAVPVVVVPLVQKAFEGPSIRARAGLPVRLREVFLLQWPFGGERCCRGRRTRDRPTCRQCTDVVAHHSALRISAHDPARQGPLTTVRAFAVPPCPQLPGKAHFFPIRRQLRRGERSPFRVLFTKDLKGVGSDADKGVP
ncbi:hypothetical protein SALBM311S_09498 [Streptomyces alboniger]